MKVDVVNMLSHAARIVDGAGDGGRAYAMLVFVNHLRLLMRQEVTLEEFNRVYVGADRDPIDIDATMPVTKQ